MASSEYKWIDLGSMEEEMNECWMLTIKSVLEIMEINNHIAPFFVFLERECDLDKHCGVLDPDRKKVCTRLLTCNVRSTHLGSHVFTVLVFPFLMFSF